MPSARYYFDIGPHRDDVGRVCADMITAKRQAASMIGSLLQDEPDQLWCEREITVSVRTIDGMQLFSVVVLGLLRPASMRLNG